MFLKSLVLKGFKSFADTTKLDFEPGVTVVVGPNGSGKSNLVDAISWVLGSQSPHAIRSGKMEDVIFQGSKKRAALGRAEVSLVFDNESGTIPMDFPEIKISRTLFKTGESEYAINGSVCRLMDVADLLSDGGMGKSQHTIVSQGEVDTVLNDRSEERRLVIEEAAGVLKHKKRRQRAEKRLSDTDSDLSRLGDLVREVKRQLDPLERQAEAASKHSEMLEHLNNLRLFVAGEELKGLKQEKEFLSQKHTDFKKQETELKQKQLELTETIRIQEVKLNGFSQDNSGEHLASLESLKVKTQAAVYNLRSREEKLAEDIEVSQRFKQATEENKELTIELKDISSQIKKYKQGRDELQLELGNLESVEDEIKEISAKIEVFQKNEQETIAQLESDEAELSEKTNTHTQMNHELDSYSNQLKETREVESQLLLKLQMLNTAQDLVTQVENPYEADILGNLISTEPGYEQAVATALGDFVKAILPKDSLKNSSKNNGAISDIQQNDKQNTTQKILEALKEKNLSGLVLSDTALNDTYLDAHSNDNDLRDGSSEGSALDQALPYLHPFVSVNDNSETKPILERLFHKILKGVLVADDWRKALELHLQTGNTVVSKDGDKFSKAGFQIGNPNANVDTALTSAARKSNLAEAKANLSEVQGLLLTMKAKFKSLEESERAALISKKTLQSQIEQGTKQLEEARDELIRATQTFEELERKHRAHSGGKMEELQSLKDSADTAQQRQKEIEIALSANNQKLESLREQIEHNPEQNLNFNRGDIILQLGKLFENVQSQIDVELNTLREKRRSESQQSTQIAEELKKSRSEKDTADEELAKMRKSATQTEISFAEITAHFENAVQNLEKDLESSLNQALEAECPELPEGKTAKDRIDEIEHELRLIGPVNHLALKEYENIKARHKFLTEQIQDIKDARKELRNLIRKIDLEIANAFEVAFSDIAASFEQLFQIAFPGGEGKLSLSNPENPLETGVDITARPGEKSIKRLSLLSGGERSLVALTFLFSVIKCRPAPFCILDEVDAALDDINLCRFLDLVAELTNDTQLLIISHQKRTMEAGDYLYGISMPTEGITKVISEKKSSNQTSNQETNQLENKSANQSNQTSQINHLTGQKVPV